MSAESETARATREKNLGWFARGQALEDPSSLLPTCHTPCLAQGLVTSVHLQCKPKEISRLVPPTPQPSYSCRTDSHLWAFVEPARKAEEEREKEIASKYKAEIA